MEEKVLGLGDFKDIDSFVSDKLRRLEEADVSFEALFELMFSEGNNLMYEKSEGYRIVKTTYGQAKSEILSIAGDLKEKLSLEEGSAVGLSMDNSLLLIEVFWAIILCGYRPVLLNLRLSDTILEKALEDSGARAVVSDGREYSLKTVSADSLSREHAPISCGAFGQEIMVMSSGTSDHVKLCAYSAEEFRYQIHDSYRIIQECAAVKKHYDGYIKLLTFLPFYHVFGLFAMYIWFAFFSRAFVQLNDMAPNTIVNTIKRHKVTHIFAVPLFWETVYEQAIKTIRGRGEKTYKKFQKGIKLSRKLSGMKKVSRWFSKTAFREVRENLFGESISFLITGGSSIRPEVVEFFNAIGYQLADGYGMTEIGITSVELSDSKKILNSCFVGKPMTSCEYMINENGELLVRGKSIAKYIIENGKKTVTDKSQWFNTRDLAECVDGRYRILGRTDDLIVSSNGENLNPNLYEPKLSLEGTNGVCIATDGRTPVLIVSVNRRSDKKTLEKLDRDIKEKLSELKLTGRIGRILYVSDKLMTGDEFKLNRRRLAEACKAGSFTIVDPHSDETAEDDDETILLLRQVFAVALDRDISEIASDSDFFTDLGGTSLDYLAATAKLQEDSDLTI